MPQASESDAEASVDLLRIHPLRGGFFGSGGLSSLLFFLFFGGSSGSSSSLAKILSVSAACWATFSSLGTSQVLKPILLAPLQLLQAVAHPPADQLPAQTRSPPPGPLRAAPRSLARPKRRRLYLPRPRPPRLQGGTDPRPLLARYQIERLGPSEPLLLPATMKIYLAASERLIFLSQNMSVVSTVQLYMTTCVLGYIFQ